MGKPSETSAWTALLDHSKHFKRSDFRLSELFDSSADRFDGFSISHENLLLDFSKNFVDQDTLALLLELARQCQLPAAIEAMFTGQQINTSEQRAVLHVALREPAASNAYPQVAESLGKMETFVNQLRDGEWRGYSGKQISDVVNIGIGGSDLGPAMVTEALSAFADRDLRVHFVQCRPCSPGRHPRRPTGRYHPVYYCLQVLYHVGDSAECRCRTPMVSTTG